MMRAVRSVKQAVREGSACDHSLIFHPDSLMTEVMRGSWRNEGVCIGIETWDVAGQAAQAGVCSGCRVADLCFWAALIEEREFRSTSVIPSGIRGGVEGARRKFILRELNDAEIMSRYRAALQSADAVNDPPAEDQAA